MKEIKVRLDDNEYLKLAESAKKDMRSVSKQVAMYILRAIENDQQNQSV